MLSVLRGAEEFIAEHLVFSAGRNDAELSRLRSQAGTDAPAGLFFRNDRGDVALGMVHQIAGGIIFDDFAVIERNRGFDEIRVQQDAVLHSGEIDGAFAVVDDVIAGLQIGDAPACEEFLRFGEGGFIVEGFGADLAGIDEGSNVAARFRDAQTGVPKHEIVGGEIAFRIVDMGDFVMAHAPELRRRIFSVALEKLGFALQEFWRGLADVIGEGTVVNEGGVILEVIGGFLKVIAEHRDGFVFQIIEKDFRLTDRQRAVFKTLLHAVKLFTEHPCVFSHRGERLVVRIGNGFTRIYPGGEGERIIAHLRDEPADIAQLRTAQRQGRQRRLCTARFLHQLRGNAVDLPGRARVFRFLEHGFHI